LIDAMPLQARFIKGFNNQTQNWTDLDAQLLSGLQISPAQALIASLLALLACLTIFGNSLVILAVLRDHHLRTITNYFIPTCFMGLVVVPFSAVSYATSDRWLFGPVWCDLWHAFDVLSTTASILNLCIIAMERYWAVENPISYPSRLTRRRCLMLVSAAWILASFISFPAIYWWRATAEATAPGEAYECRFTSDPVYLICSSVVSFYAPLLVMVFVYCKIYRTATQLVRGWHTGAKVVLKSGCPGANGGGGDGANGGRRSSAIVLRIHRGRRELTPTEAATAAAAAAKEQHSSLGLRRKLARFSREQRAAKTLGVVMGVFIACWLPFFVCNVAVAVAPEALGRGGRAFGQVATWLGYANSCINPAIYAHSMRDFRRAFIRLLGCQRRSRQAAACGGRRSASRSRCCGHPDDVNESPQQQPTIAHVRRRRRERQARHGQMLKADSSFVRRGQRAASLTAAGPLRLASAAGAEEAAQQRPPSPIYACSSSTPMLHSAGAKDLISLSQLTQSGTRQAELQLTVSKQCAAFALLTPPQRQIKSIQELMNIRFGPLIEETFSTKSDSETLY
uniref:G_PROTEIN_RECEP_F1_2 domain-containing protein n=1 Tax=Macrostomum lignano TaxID=282301 RepID=A0A1I8GQY3_9PLAT